MSTSSHRILFFDGYCSLCNGLIDWLVRRDKRGVLKIASLQGGTAKANLDASQRSEGIDVDTLIYLRDGIAWERSTGVLRAVADLGGLWSAARIFLLVPRVLRDAVYGLVARNRYRIFGKRDTCRLPTPEERTRFLE